MNKEKKSKLFFNIAVTATISAMLASTSLMAGCGLSGGETKETIVIEETQNVTKLVEGVYQDENGNIIIPNTASESENDKSESSSSKTDNKKKESSSSKESAAASSKTSGSAQSNASSQASAQASKSGSSSKSSSSKAASSSKTSSSSKSNTSAGSGTLVVDGKKFNVGDTVTCTYSLTTPDVLQNYQLELDYDGALLKVKSAKLAKPASYGGIINYKLENKIKMNGTSIDGYDYSNGGAFLTVVYEIIGKGETATKANWEVATDMNERSLLSSNGQPKSGMKFSASYKAD